MVLLPKLPSYNSPFKGMSLLKYIAKTLDLDSYIEDYLNMFFFNSALPTGVLETEAELNDSIVNRLRGQFERRHGGVKNAHKLAVLEKGLKFNNTSFKISELQAKEMQDLIRDKIFALFRVPKSIVGIVEDVNRANAEASEINFCKRAVLPRLRMLQGQINQFLIPKFSDGQNIWFEFENQTPNDEKYNAEVYQIYLNAGVMLPNEVREELGLEQMDEDEYKRFQDMKNPIKPNEEKPEEEKPNEEKPKKAIKVHKNPTKINRFKGIIEEKKDVVQTHAP
jgi:HK97 family phage portal protein